MKTIICALFSICFIHGYCQSGFVPGYIVSSDRDTLRGFILNKDWGKGPFKVEFKKTEEALPATYLPADIKGFSVNNFDYVSRNISMDISPYKNEGLLQTPERRMTYGYFFLKILIRSNGGISLYEHIDNNAKEHLYYSSGDSLIELRLIKYFDFLKYKEVRIYEYIAELSELTEDCEMITGLSELEFSATAIKKVIIEYNDCFSNTDQFIYTEPKAKSLFGISAGISASNIIYHVDGSGPYFARADYTPGLGYQAGIFHYLDLPKARESVWFFSELIYHKFKSSGYGYYTVYSFYETVHINFEQAEIKLITSIKLQANTDEFKPYLQIGVTNTYSTLNSNTTVLVEENKYNGIIDTSYFENELIKSIYHLGVITEGGITYKNTFYLSAAFERSITLNPYESFPGYERDIYFTLRYAF